MPPVIQPNQKNIHPNYVYLTKTDTSGVSSKVLSLFNAKYISYEDYRIVYCSAIFEQTMTLYRDIHYTKDCAEYFRDSTGARISSATLCELYTA